ncbi:MAG: glycosyltransferase family 2 protein [Actinobacteria bacterium]|nr:glycosyltransferase family 2 protein [Actinomycetota bacterium]
MSVFIVIPVHNRLEFTRACLASLGEQTCGDFQIVVIDDGSTDGTHAALAAEHPDVVVLWGDGDLWWTGAMNKGLAWVLPRAGADDHLLVLNNDTALPPDYLQTMLDLARSHPRALLGSVAVSWDDHERIVDGGVCIDWRTTRSMSPAAGLTRSQAFERLGDTAPVSVLSGRGTLIPVEAFRRVGLYDRQRLPHYGADWEFARRAQRAGFELLMSYGAPVYSHEDATGLHPSKQTLDARQLLRAYFDMRSPSNLRTRWWFAQLCAEPAFVPLFFAVDVLRVVGGGVRRQTAARCRKALCQGR